MAYLNVSHFFLTWSEKEMGGGFVDFYLEPFLARYRDMKFGYLVELKYIARNALTRANWRAKSAKPKPNWRAMPAIHVSNGWQHKSR